MLYWLLACTSRLNKFEERTYGKQTAHAAIETTDYCQIDRFWSADYLADAYICLLCATLVTTSKTREPFARSNSLSIVPMLCSPSIHQCDGLL